MILNRFQTVMAYVEKARTYMPNQADKGTIPPPPKRSNGIDIEFPTPAAPPRFWLKHADLEGNYQGVAAAGTLAHATTDPARVGKPLTLDLKGRHETQNFILQAVLDHVTDVSKDNLVLSGVGLPLTQMVSDSAFGKAVRGGTGDARLALNVTGGAGIAGQIQLAMRSIKLDGNELLAQVGGGGGDALKATFVNNIAHAIESTPQIMVNAELQGTFQDPSIKMSSNLTNVFADVVKKSAGELIGKQRQRLEAELDGIVKAKSGEVEEKLKGAETQANQRLAGLNTQVQQKINDATGINLGGSNGGSPIPGVKLPSLNGLFKKK
jgi:uncharacterized protein (TIGR03545 family)